MENILNFLKKLTGLKSVNEGYIGLTSFEKPSVEIKEEIKAETPARTSLTGILRRAS